MLKYGLLKNLIMKLDLEYLNDNLRKEIIQECLELLDDITEHDITEMSTTPKSEKFARETGPIISRLYDAAVEKTGMNIMILVSDGDISSDGLNIITGGMSNGSLVKHMTRLFKSVPGLAREFCDTLGFEMDDGIPPISNRH